MKRCPQCEFIYEDEQVTCDMDGAMLALDRNVASINGQRSMVRSFVVPAAVGIALAVVVCLAFYSSPLLIAKPDARQLSPAQMSAPAPTQPAIDVPSPTPSPEAVPEPDGEEQAASPKRASDANHANRSTSDSRLTIRRGVPPLPRVPTLPRLPPARVRKSSNDNVQV
ncbi:MAG TPA: hypothetical protein VF089_14495, partial [Candidatus Binatia bacterium]